MLELLLFAAATAASPAVDSLAEVEHAITVGRLDQARSMIASAIANGARGDAVDRLLADLAYAAGNNDEALARYTMILKVHASDERAAERAAICAIKAGNIELAETLADRATSLPHVSWRAWNARGVLADLRNDFETAESLYQRALALAPHEPEVLNNIGWSRILRGDWPGALDPLRTAEKLMPKSRRIANNLELARAAVAEDLPERRRGEADDAWASRLNDAGVAARLRGQRGRAVAAFARAIEARASWYERAANNLEATAGTE